jgi:hypothetical protein
VLCGASSGCALGFGAIPNATSPAGASRSTEMSIVGSGPGYVILQEYSGPALGEGFNLPIGVSGGVQPSLTVLLPVATESSPRQAVASVGWIAHADLYVPLTGWNGSEGVFASKGPNLGITLQYQQGFMDGDYVGGFGLGSRHHGVLGYLGIGLGPIGIELGGGGLFEGRVGVGGRGNVLNDTAFTFAQSPASGFRTSARFTLFISGGGFLQMKTALRLETGYQHLFAASTAPGLPLSLGGFNAGFELVISFF